jgi:hypothetical protein
VVEPDEDKSAEIAELEAKGFHVVENHILAPAPPEPDVITPELQAIHDRDRAPEAAGGRRV